MEILPYHQTHSLATKRRPPLPVPAFSDAATDPRWLSRTHIYSLDPCSMHNMPQPQPRASRPWSQHITTSNAPKRLSHTRFPAKHEHKASISTSEPIQNTSAGFPCTHRPNIFTQITKYSLAILPYHQTHSLATKRRPPLPVPAFSDAATDPRWLSRTPIYSLDPCSCLLYTSDAAGRSTLCRSRWSPYH